MRRKTALLLVLALLLPALTLPVRGAEAEVRSAPQVSCYAACVVDMDTGETLYDYRAGSQEYPASTTKVMTALLCLKYGDLNDVVTVQSGDFSGLVSDATSMNLVTGEQLSLRTLLEGLLVVSACDAANVIARHVGGTRQDFIRRMNQEAADLGCTGTHFSNAHGLHSYDHYTTAGDLARILTAAMEYETFRRIVSASYLTIPATNYHGARTLTNTNYMLPDSAYSAYRYAYCTGGKTGTTGMAGYCLASTAEKDGVRLACVLLGAPDNGSRFTQSRTLLEYGFSVDPGRSLTAARVALEEDRYVYDGSAHCPAVTVTLRGETLTEGTDYSVAYSGNVHSGTASVTVNGTGDYTGSVTVPFAIESPLPFSDVPTASWSFESIREAYETGLVEGRDGGLFAPEAAVTRGEAVTMLYRLMGSPEVLIETSFTDLPQSYYIPAVCWAQQRGVVRGRTAALFAPGDPVTRQELAVMLYRLGGSPVPVLETGYADLADISQYAQAAMAWTVAEGLLEGREGGRLAPRENATRAELTALLLRYRTRRTQSQAA